MHRKMTPYLFLAPYCLSYLIVSVFPFLFSFVFSFTDWNGFTNMSFVGLTNYIRMFTQDNSIALSYMNTFIFLGIAIPLQLLIGLFLSIVIKDFISRSKGSFQLLNFLPYLTAPVAIGLIFQMMFDWNYGTVNQLLSMVSDSPPIYWLGRDWPARFVVIFVMIWRHYGYVMIIISAGLSTISQDLYEAADIDGATWLQKHVRITIPLLKPILRFVIVISLINGFQLFDDPYMLFSIQNQPFGGPNGSVLTVMMNMYKASFINFQLGYGAAIAYVLFAVIFIFTMTVNRLFAIGED